VQFDKDIQGQKMEKQYQVHTKFFWNGVYEARAQCGLSSEFYRLLNLSN